MADASESEDMVRAARRRVRRLRSSRSPDVDLPPAGEHDEASRINETHSVTAQPHSVTGWVDTECPRCFARARDPQASRCFACGASLVSDREKEVEASGEDIGDVGEWGDEWGEGERAVVRVDAAKTYQHWGKALGAGLAVAVLGSLVFNPLVGLVGAGLVVAAIGLKPRYVKPSPWGFVQGVFWVTAVAAVVAAIGFVVFSLWLVSQLNWMG